MPEKKIIREPAKDIPVFSECDILVVGGGPAGLLGPLKDLEDRVESVLPKGDRRDAAEKVVTAVKGAA